MLAATLPQIVDVIKGLQASLGPTLDIADPVFQTLYDIIGQLTKASADLAACTGAKVDCTGLVILSGYAIKIAMPIIRAYLTVKFPPAAVALALLQPTIDSIADGLIAGNDMGLTDLLKFIVDSTTGPVGSLLPAPLKAILDVITPILNIIKNCPTATPTATLGPVTTGAPMTTGVPTGIISPTGTGGASVIATTATTTTSAVATATPSPDCIALIEPIKDVIRNLLVTIEGLPLGPEASQLLKIAVGTNLTAYFDNGIDTAGSTAAMLAATLPQIVEVIKGLQSSIGPALDIADPVFQTLYDIIGQLTKASADLAACTGAKVDCTGLVILTGYAIKIAMPIIRAYLTYKFPPAAVALALLQPTIDAIADGLIAGNDMGLTDLLKFITDTTSGIAGSLLPAPLKAILDVITPIMNIIKNCPASQSTPLVPLPPLI
ncbi:hypothetical protein BGZ68_002083 [Mortierella alpina]|nr:hypothetical protein BGZ68_002083 [Mortierella alpina]